MPHFTDLYAVMNKKRWGLIPTQHNRIVQSVCPDCRERYTTEQINAEINRAT